uniref:Myomegalin-like n=1 Tax=Saccoglossus kowalevskii TaxID=10224 RepID=A0ABM0MFX1_SACKO|nr:PREDICTED: myomegalin-like [Saccoglossus kowalevskii]
MDFTDRLEGPPMIQNMSSGRMSPIMPRTMGDYQERVDKLKRENFALKIRIYFMEEKLEKDRDITDEERGIIDLKIEIENLKQDLEERNKLLTKAHTAIQCLTNEKETMTTHFRDDLRVENQMEISKFKAQAELAEEEAELLRQKLDEAQEELGQANKKIAEYEKKLGSSKEERTMLQEMQKGTIVEKDRIIAQLNDALKTKNQLIDQMNIERTESNNQVIALQEDICQLKEAASQKEMEVQTLQEIIDTEKDIEREQTEHQIQNLKQEYVGHKRLMEEEAKTLRSLVEDKDSQLKNLDKALVDAQSNLKELENEMTWRDQEIKNHETNALKRDKAIKGLAEMLQKKEKEVKQLCDQVEEQEKTIKETKEAMHNAELYRCQGAEEQQMMISKKEDNILNLKSQLHERELECERLQKSLARKQTEVDGLKQGKDLAEFVASDTLKNKEEAIKDLTKQVGDLKYDLSEQKIGIEQHYQQILQDHQDQIRNKDNLIQKLQQGIDDKDKIITEVMEKHKIAPESHKAVGKDIMIESLRQELKKRERDAENAIDEKFKIIESKDDEIRSLNMTLRDRDRDVQRALSEITMTEDKNLRLENQIQELSTQVDEYSRALDLQRTSLADSASNHDRVVAEKEAMIRKLQEAVKSKDNRVQSAAENLLMSARPDSLLNGDEASMIQELNVRLKERDKLLEDVMAERSKAVAAHEKASHDLMQAIHDKDHHIKEINDRHNRLIAEKDNTIRELEKAISERDRELEKFVENGRDKDRMILALQKQQPQSSLQANHAIQQTSPLASSNSEVSRLKKEINKLQGELLDKRAMIHELSAGKGDEYIEKLKAHIRKQDEEFTAAKNIIEKLQKQQRADKMAHLELAQAKRKNVDLETELHSKEENIDALINAGNVKDQIIKDLQNKMDSPKKERDEREYKDQEEWHKNMEEVKKLKEALYAEKVIYESMSLQNSTMPDVDDDDFGQQDALRIQLSAVEALRAELEKSLRETKNMRDQFKRSLPLSPSSSGFSSDADLLGSLKEQLDESRRWNTSLQSRLEELQRNSNVSPDRVVPQKEIAERSSHMDLSEYPISSANQTTVSTQHNVTLGEINEDDQRSIPGQEDEEESSRLALLSNQTQRINQLEVELKESQNHNKNLQRQLAFALENPAGYSKDEDNSIVAVLKEQLDQAKTLLQERDNTLAHKEEELDDVRHKLTKVKSSPANVSPSTSVGLFQELDKLKTQLSEVLKDNSELRDENRSLRMKIKEIQDINGQLQDDVDGFQEDQKSIQDLEQVINNKDQEVCHLQRELEKHRSDGEKYELMLQQQRVDLNEARGMNNLLKVERSKHQEAIEKLQKDNAELESELGKFDGEWVRKEHLVERNQEVAALNKELEHLREELEKAFEVETLLRKQVQLDTSTDEEKPVFNPQLIVDMAQEIERQKTELEATHKELIDTRRKLAVSPERKSQGSVTPLIEDVNSALRQQIDNLRAEISHLKSKDKKSSSKLQATEATVRQLSDKLKVCRNRMKALGIVPPVSPAFSKSQSESNLYNSNVEYEPKWSSALVYRENDDVGSSPSTIATEYEECANVGELQKKVEDLESQLQKAKKVAYVFQKKLKELLSSRSSSPTRSCSSPSRSCVSLCDDSSDRTWYEVLANEEALGKLQEEVEVLKNELQNYYELNSSLQNEYVNLETDFRGAQCDGQALRGRLQLLIENHCALKNKLQAMEAERINLIDEKEVLTAENRVLKKEKSVAELESQFLADDLNNLKEKMPLSSSQTHEHSFQELDVEIAALKKQLVDSRNLSNILKSHLLELVNTMSALVKQNEVGEWCFVGGVSPHRMVSLKDKADQSRRLIEDLDDTLSESRSSVYLHAVSEADIGSSNIFQTPPHAQSGYDTDISTSLSQDTIRSQSPQRTLSNSQSGQLQSRPKLADTNLLAELNNKSKKLAESEALIKSLKNELEVFKNVAYSQRAESRGNSDDESEDSLKQHLDEIRALRKRLEESIDTNDELRKQLEDKLAMIAENGSEAANLYLQETNVELSLDNAELRKAIAALENTLAERDQQLLDSENQLYQKQQSQAGLDELCKTISRLEQKLSEKDQQLVDSDNQVRIKNQTVAGLKEKLSEKDKQFADIEDQLYVKNEALSDKDRKIAENERAVRHSQKALDKARTEYAKSQSDIKRLKEEKKLLMDQIQEGKQLNNTLKMELSFVEKLTKDDSRSSKKSPSSGLDLGELLKELRQLRIQLERSIETNNALRVKLEELSNEKLSPSSRSSQSKSSSRSDLHRISPRRLFEDKPVQTDNFECMKSASSMPTLYNGRTSPHYTRDGSSISPRSRSHGTVQLDDPILSSMSGVSPLRMSGGDIQTRKHRGRDVKVIGDVLEYESLKQQMEEISVVLTGMEARIHERQRMAIKQGSHEVPMLKEMTHNVESLQLFLAEGLKSMATFYVETVYSREEYKKLKFTISKQQAMLKDALERLEKTNQLKKGMENAIARQLDKTHDVLKQAKINLEHKAQDQAKH